MAIIFRLIALFHLNKVSVTQTFPLMMSPEPFSRVSDKISRVPDGIPAYFLKRVSVPILDVICFLFKLSLSIGVVTLQWKSAIITPVFKKGSRDLPSNYRPVSLTCVLCCVFEHIVADHLFYHLSLHNVISEN